jgi:ATP-binding cassette subfamily B protein
MINVGLEQNGIESSVPEVFSQETYGEISLLFPDEIWIGDAENGVKGVRDYYIGIKEAYARKQLTRKEYGAYEKKYAKLNEGEEVYLLKKNIADFYGGDFSDEDMSRLKEELKIPVIVYAAFNGMFGASSNISVLGFLEDNTLLSSIGAMIHGYNIGSEEYGVYIESHKDYTMRQYFEEMKEKSVPDENGVIIYDDGDKKLVNMLLKSLINGLDTSGYGGLADGVTFEQIVEQLTEYGYSEDEARTYAGYITGGVAAGMSREITDYIIELGNIDYLKYEYERAGLDTRRLQIEYVLKNGAFMLLYTLGSILSVAAIVFLAARVSSAVSRDIRRDVFSKVLSFSNAEFDVFSASSLITRSSNDIDQFQSLFFLLIKNAFAAFFTVTGGILYLRYLLKINPYMLLIIVAMIAVIAVIMAIVYAFVMPKFVLGQKLLDKINLVMRERLGGIFVIRANGNEPHEEARYEKVNKKITVVNLFISRVSALLIPLFMLILNVWGALGIWLAVDREFLIDGSVLPGSLLAFLQYAVQIIYAFLLFAGTFVFLPRAVVAVRRIKEVLAVKPTIADAENAVELDPEDANFDLSFENVSFKYGGAPDYALKDLSFTVKSGKMTAVVGATGSGKTTLINLILRLYDPTEGVIRIGGRDIRGLKQSVLRKNIGLVSQQPVLFSGTVGENLSAGKENASEEEMERAIAVAKADDFVSEKRAESGSAEGAAANKFDMPVSRGGKNLSGGQKQRLSIARAVVKKPKLYLFDDSFSALDYTTEANLRAELVEETRESRAGVVIISQRIASVLNADNIIVLDGGKIVGQGTHAELLRSSPEYLAIARSQLPVDELEKALNGGAEPKGNAAERVRKNNARNGVINPKKNGREDALIGGGKPKKSGSKNALTGGGKPDGNAALNGAVSSPESRSEKAETTGADAAPEPRNNRSEKLEKEDADNGRKG